ncbi:MAG: accessory factor UbiK family protein [Gammaproteobacteria bacterium]|nr:accessory factor UbiK family protein [Gammaproteobacteria bacterium]MCP4089990.1 accessory factor UbiK family protein [Gammaproteobacteria bacterium]MCP4276321.1 accessory factor UbiK family protein [Gammaproteobacteria bacterium]MCP4928799.1 accessory factor UbiK family protein [Gammaproteobacteria bacterium]
MDKKVLDDLANKLADAVPGDLHELRNDLESNFRGLLQNRLNKLDLVTREEFDIQRKVLERTREKLERIERELEALQRDTVQSPGTDPGTEKNS